VPFIMSVFQLKAVEAFPRLKYSTYTYHKK
jgi:hypothetical protein